MDVDSCDDVTGADVAAGLSGSPTDGAIGQGGLSMTVDNSLLGDPHVSLDDPAMSMDDQTPGEPQGPRQRMLYRVANTDAHFKHQQRGDPDLTLDEKRRIAGEILDKNPGTFLNRYGKYLMLEDVSYFENMRGDYTVNFYLQEINKRLEHSTSQVKVRNRRYEAMKRLVSEKEYFSDHEMKARDPLLYEEMVGQHLTEDEVMEQAQDSNMELSNVLFKHIESIHNNELYAKQRLLEESQLEEGDSDEDIEEEMEEEDEDGGKPSISDAERHLLRQEFTTVMEQRFIHGEDPDFNYQDVDESEEYDSLDIRTQDEQERYFDDEDAISVHSQDSSIDDFKYMQIRDAAVAGTSDETTSNDSACRGGQSKDTVQQTCQTISEEQSNRTVQQTSQTISEEQSNQTVQQTSQTISEEQSNQTVQQTSQTISEEQSNQTVQQTSQTISEEQSNRTVQQTITDRSNMIK